MTSKVEAAAAEAAREAAAERAAAEARRRAAEAAAEARAEAARKAAAAAAAAARLKSKAGKKDELSTGVGTALKVRAQTQLAMEKPATVASKAPAGSMSPRALQAAQAAAAKPKLSPADQATADSAKVQKAWDDAKAKGKNDAAAADAAAHKLRDLATANEKDPIYVNTLVRASMPTVNQITATLGQNARGKFAGSDTDISNIKDTVRALSDVANKAGVVSAYQLGDSLAKALPNSSELKNVDDGFYDYHDSGGKPTLFAATEARLRAEGKDKAADKLPHQNKGLLDSVVGGLEDLAGGALDLAKGVVGAVAGGGAAVLGAAEDGVKDVVHVATDAGKLAVDTAKGTVDLVEDAAKFTVDQAKSAVEFAVKNGLKIVGALLGKVHGLARDGIDAALGVGDKIKSLGPNDSYTLGGSVDVGLGVGGSIAGDITVTRDEKGKGYTVSGELKGDIGLSLGGKARVGAGGQMEMHFDNANDAKQAALTLAEMGAAALTPEFAPILAPTPKELGFMKDHLSAIEVDATGSVGVDSSFDAGGVKLGASAKAEADEGYRIEFEKGKPVAMVRETKLSGSAGESVGLDLIKDKLGTKIGSDQVSGAITIETRIPLNAAKIGDVAAFLASPTTAAFAGAATTSIKVEGEAQAGNDGVHAEVAIDGIDGKEAQQVVGRLLKGDVGHAFDGVKVEASGKEWTFKEHGLKPELDLEVAGIGFDIEGHSVVRDVRNPHGFDVNVG